MILLDTHAWLWWVADAQPDLHRDPVDRVLIATALEFDATLAAKDAVIRRYPDVRVLWGA